MNIWHVTACLLAALGGQAEPSCKYGGRGSLTTTCTDATSSFFKLTNYRFDHLDETVHCVNCTLKAIETGNFDFYYNQIRTLNLTSSQITTLKPKAFIGLLFLEKLLLSSNQITEIRPLTFSGINKIQHLDVQNNKLTVLVANGLKELTNLKTLLLQNNDLAIVERGAFNELASLVTLELSYNELADTSDIFEGLTSLGMLGLESNIIQDIQVANASTLVELNLASNRIKSVDEHVFLTLSKLETLNLSSNPVETILAGSFRGLNALEVLDLNNCSIPDVPKGTLFALHNLRSLDLSNNRIASFKSGVYSGLPELRTLNLSHNKIENYFKTGNFPLSRLHTLDLSYNNLDDLDYKLLVNHIPSLAYLELSHNPWRCSIAKEMEDEFVNENIRFNLGPNSNDSAFNCNNTKSRYVSANDSGTFEMESASLLNRFNAHHYILYVFILVSLAFMSFMLYLQYKNQNEINSLVRKDNVAETRLIQGDDVNPGDDDY